MKGKKPRKKKGKDFYPVLKMIGNIPIRANNLVSIYIPMHEMEKIANIMNRTGLSCAKVLSHSSTPCEQCKGTAIVISINDVPVEIPRGLFVFKKTNSGAIMGTKKTKP